ncbi:uncharacterized protein BDV14DRAFT_185843 [Aspergillus stella-maris]|uniref:uncharacterized protein n=1 Tax=Aspergillus stella-maris TaxID=1810926 RepID=UPI003CCD2122
MNYAPRPFKPIQYVPANQQETILNSPVLYTSAAAHAPLETGGNHWSIYLTTSPTSSVQLDMTPSYTYPSTKLAGGSKGNLVISALPYLLPSFATRDVRLDVSPGLTVGDFVDVLEKEGRHRYEFSELGEGCRFWVTEQLGLLLGKGLLLDFEQVDEAREAILVQWPGKEKYPLVVGGYYG